MGKLEPSSVPWWRTLVGWLGLVFVTATQSGCFTLLTATACVATGGDDGCGDAVVAAAAVDALVIETVARADGYGASDPPSDAECREGEEVCHDDPAFCCIYE